MRPKPKTMPMWMKKELQQQTHSHHHDVECTSRQCIGAEGRTSRCRCDHQHQWGHKCPCTRRGRLLRETRAAAAACGRRAAAVNQQRRGGHCGWRAEGRRTCGGGSTHFCLRGSVHSKQPQRRQCAGVAAWRASPQRSCLGPSAAPPPASIGPSPRDPRRTQHTAGSGGTRHALEAAARGCRRTRRGPPLRHTAPRGGARRRAGRSDTPSRGR